MYKKVYIVDFIGIHSGMHYYNESFSKEISTIPGIEVEILSNYSTTMSKRPFFKNFFEMKKPWNILFVFSSYFSLMNFLFSKKNSHFILHHYGGIIDILFLSLTIIFSSKITIVVHDLYALENKHKTNILTYILYKYFVKTVIIHSEKNELLLKKLKYNNKMFIVPHFKYSFNKYFSVDSIDKDILSIFNSSNNCKKILFFGHIRLSKGIDILSQVFCSLPEDEQCKYNMIIAGNDTHNIIANLEIHKNKHASKILRIINDNELKYIFTHCEYVVLPYKDISQSGILEMAFYFRKPVLMSRLPYFEQILSEFPSFGLLFDNTSDGLYNLFLSLSNISTNYYSKQDVLKYEQREKIESFVNSFSSEMLELRYNKLESVHKF